MAIVTSVELCKGFDHVILTLDHTREILPWSETGADGQPVCEIREGDVYRVTGTGFESTHKGADVGDSQVFSFRSEDEAKAKANGWFAELTSKGYQRVK